MQLILAFLDPPPATPAPLSKELCNAEARAAARNILARIIAQAFAPPNQTEATDE
jgi:hypothetical protein